LKTAIRKKQDPKTIKGGLADDAVKALNEYRKGVYAQTARKLALELKSLNESQFLQRMEGLARSGKCRRVTAEIRASNQVMVRYEFPDGSMVRYMPKGDAYRPGPTYIVEVNKDTLPDTGDPGHTAFKVNPLGQAVPKTIFDVNLPNGIEPGSPAEEEFRQAVMDQGHIRLSR
jgi:hypothetical protein